MSLMRDIYKDYRRYRATDERWFTVLFLSQGFWASCVYRFSRLVMTRVKIRFIRRICGVILSLVQKWVEIITGITMSPDCDIGEGVYVGHYGQIFFPRTGKVGKNCNVQQGVTMGEGGRGETRGVPVIGDRVHIGPNAVILGKIVIGNDVSIGAGAIVTRSMPPRSVVMGNPARVVSYEGSFDLIRYDGMDTDPDRLASLAEQRAQGAPDGKVPVTAATAANGHEKLANTAAPGVKVGS